MSPVLAMMEECDAVLTSYYVGRRERVCRNKFEVRSPNRQETEKKPSSRHTWDICEKVLPRVDNHDSFQQWPDGHCKFVYSAADAVEAGRHMSGWAMRNTNNHNALVLKKSCLGVLVCSRPCKDAEARPLINLRPAICDKARAKQIGKPCPTPGCNGRLQLKPCEGHGGYPVTHFWRTSGNTIYFQSKGFHSHPRPIRLWPLIERRQRVFSDKTKKSHNAKEIKAALKAKLDLQIAPKAARHSSNRTAFMPLNYNHPGYTTMMSYSVPSCDLYRSPIRSACSFESENYHQLNQGWPERSNHHQNSCSSPNTTYWMPQGPGQTNYSSCEYQAPRNEPLDYNQNSFFSISSVDNPSYSFDYCNSNQYHIVHPVKQEMYQNCTVPGYDCSDQSSSDLNSSMFYPPSNESIGTFALAEVDGYRSVHQAYRPDYLQYFSETTSAPAALQESEVVPAFLLDAMQVESTLNELDPVKVEEELRSLVSSSTEFFCSIAPNRNASRAESNP